MDAPFDSLVQRSKHAHTYTYTYKHTLNDIKDNIQKREGGGGGGGPLYTNTQTLCIYDESHDALETTHIQREERWRDHHSKQTKLRLNIATGYSIRVGKAYDGIRQHKGAYGSMRRTKMLLDKF